jgi:hypothetical protein
MSIREFQPSRAVEVIVIRRKSENSYGTGYRIGGRLVLTAAHLLRDEDAECTVRDKQGFGKKNAKIVWKAPQELDIALLELPKEVAGIEPIALGQLPEGKAGENIWFQMYGYPGWGWVEGKQRSAASGLQVEGRIYLADTPPLLLRIDENLASEYLANKVISEVKGDSRKLESEWRGMSGAAVVCKGLVVAVQKQHPRPMQPNYVAATPLWTIYDNEQWYNLLKKHGINPKPEVVRLEPPSPKSLWRELGDNFLKRFSSEAIFYKYCEDLSDKVENEWVKPNLDNPFYSQVPIQLSLEQRFDLIELVSPEQPEQLKKVLPKGTKPIAIFNDLGRAKSLLILGEPGSGKTIALLELTQSLVKESKRASTSSVPIFLNLSSWTDTYPSLDLWLAHQLDVQYNIRNKRFIKALIQEQNPIFILDGLDEVIQEFQTSCIQAINKFRSDHGQVSIVVGSRLEDYEQHPIRLKFRYAVSIQALSPEEINQYLKVEIEALKAEEKKDSDDSDLKDKIKQLVVVKGLIYKDRNLQQIVDTPLMLSIIYAVTGSQSSISSILDDGSPEERRQNLFDAYIERVLNRRKSDQKKLQEQQYEKNDIKRWLSWISHCMTRQSNNFESKAEFRIEQLQPSCLETDAQKTRYRFLVFSTLFWRGSRYSVLIGSCSYLSTIGFFLNSSSDINLSSAEATITGIATIAFGVSTSLVLGILATSFEEIKTFKALSWSVNTIILRVRGFLKPIIAWLKLEKDIPETPTFEEKLWTLSFMVASGLLVLKFNEIYYSRLYWANIYPQIFRHEHSLNNLILKSYESMNAVGADPSEGNALWMTATVAFWFFLGLERSQKNKEVFPAQGIIESQRVSKSVLYFVIIIQPIYFYILLKLIHAQPQFFSTQSALVAVPSIFAIFWCGGFTEIQHFALRRVLSWCDFIPFDLEIFLDQARKLLLLKRFGGSYTFFHTLLQNHFLETSIDSTEPDTST